MVFLLGILHNIDTPYINHLKLPLGEVKTLPMQICCLAFASSRRCFNILENLTNLTWAICHIRCAKFVGGFFCNTMDLFFTPWKITQFLCLLIHIRESNKQMPYYIAKLDVAVCSNIPCHSHLIYKFTMSVCLTRQFCILIHRQNRPNIW